MNTPNDAGDETIAKLFDLAVAITREHAANLSADPTLAARLDADPALRLTNAETLLGNHPEGMESYTDCLGNTCYRPAGEGSRMRRENRERHANYLKRHSETVRTEITRRFLTEIDPDWASRFTQDAAELFYWRELEAMRPGLRASTPIYTGRDEPNDYGPATRAKDIDGDDDR